MLTNVRQKEIESIALRDGEVIISRVAKELNVSVETIRRDINAMCAKNLLTKVHGGAVPVNLPITEASYHQRKNTNSKLKNKLGKYAAGLIKDSEVVAFSTGSTMEAVASNINGVRNCTVITNSIPITSILNEMYEHGLYDGKIILFGGKMNPLEHLTYGSMVTEQIQKYYADVAFVSSAGLADCGLTTSDAEEGNVSASLMKSASRVILVMESQKFCKRSVYRFADLSHVDIIVTDDENEIDSDLRNAIDEYHIELHIV